MCPPAQATTVSYEGARSASGLFHGRGRAVLANGIVCDGDWRDGLLDGEASVVFPDGVGYAGGVRGNNAEGEGVSECDARVVAAPAACTSVCTC